MNGPRPGWNVHQPDRPVLDERLTTEAASGASVKLGSSLSEIEPETSLDDCSRIGDGSTDWGGSISVDFKGFLVFLGFALSFS